MAKFIGRCIDGKFKYKAKIDGVHRFDVIEAMDFESGWFLFTINGVLIDRFETMCDIAEYIEEMDK